MFAFFVFFVCEANYIFVSCSWTVNRGPKVREEMTSSTFPTVYRDWMALVFAVEDWYSSFVHIWPVSDSLPVHIVSFVLSYTEGECWVVIERRRLFRYFVKFPLSSAHR